MSTVDQFLDALAQVESSNNPEAWGDRGCAMGRWQCHPDALWTWARETGIAPRLGETWDQLIERILRAVYSEWIVTREARVIAMRWHLGHWSYPDSKDWDRGYERRFNDAMARALGAAVT